MKKIVHYLRKQPETTRRHVLHILSIIIAILLITLWVYSLGANFSASDSREAEAQQGTEPFSVLKDNFSVPW